MQKTTKIFIVTLILFLVAVALFILFASKAKSSSDITKNPNFIPGHSQLTDPQFPVTATKPNTPLDKYDVLIVFGGINYATSGWMEENTPDSIKEKYLVYYLPWNYAINHKDTLLSVFKQLPAKSFSFAGFSAGGKSVMKVMDHYTSAGITADSIEGSPINKFILMDPSIYRDLIDSLNYSKTVMTYGSSGMIGLYGDIYPDLDQKIKEDGGKSEKHSKSHNWFVPYTLDKYL